MSTLTTVPKEADDSETTAETTTVKPAGSHRQPRSARWRKARSASDTALPPIAVLLARPVLLTICAVLGALVGFVISDGSGYRAAASIEFTVDGNDVALVEVEGKTLADRMTSAPVIKRAAAAIDESPEAIEANTTAEWQPGSTLVELAAVAPTPSQAWNRANAMAEAMIADYRDDVAKRLDAATSDANSLISERALVDPDAETARRAQVGTSLGDRQHALTERSQSVTIARKATEAISAGLTPGMGAAIGMAAGLFIGCLIALLLGSRGLRAWSLTTLRRLVPGVEVLSADRLPELVGGMAEDGDTAVAVVVPRDFREMSDDVVGELERLLALHGKATTTILPPVTAGEASEALLRRSGARNVLERLGADSLLVVVEEHSEAAAILQGRSGFRTIVVLRRHKSAVSDAVAAANAYGPSCPVLMVAR